MGVFFKGILQIIFANLPHMLILFSMSENISVNASNKGGFYKWEVLILLWFAYWFNQADRQLYNTLLEKISESLSLTPADAGLIGTIFLWVLAICFPITGFLADNFSKKWIIVFSIMLWSAATVISGACTGFWLFIIFRSAATGLGEGCFAPSNYAMISDYHDKDTRAKAMSIHTTSQYFGIIVSGLIAGWIGDRWGWRPAFFLFGSIGLVLSFIIMWRLKDKVAPMSAEQLRERKKSRPSLWEAIKIFFTVPTAIVLTLSFAGLIFVVQGYLTWSTLYLQEKFGMSNAAAGFNAVFYTHITAFAGILIAGWLSDKLAAKKAQYRVLLQSMGFLLASPFIALMGFSDEIIWVFLGFAGFGFWRGFYDANIYTVLYDVIPVKYRGSATGIMLFLGFCLGSFSPWVMGIMKPHFGLSLGIAMLSTVWLFFGLLLFVIYKLFYARDCARAMAFDANNA